VRKIWRIVPLLTAVGTIFSAIPAGAQGNIDAGRTPAQLFSDTCAACHRSVRDVRRPSAMFLRQHYTAGWEEASAMANYLNAVANDPRAAQPKRPPGLPSEPAVENSRQQQPKQQSKQAAQTTTAAEQAKSGQGQSKGRRPPSAAELRAASAAEERPPESPGGQSLALQSPHPPGSPPLILEPFEE